MFLNNISLNNISFKQQGIISNYRALVHYYHGRKHGDRHVRHGAREVVETSTCGSIGNRKREIHWAWCRLLKLQILPPDTHFLQQDHYCSNKATPPDPYQIAPLLKDQEFKCMSLWRPFLFKPPHLLSKQSKPTASWGLFWDPEIQAKACTLVVFSEHQVSGYTCHSITV